MSDLPPNPASPEADAIARRRFVMLNIVRIAGIPFLMLGIAMEVGRVPGLTGDVWRYAGLAIALTGAFTTVIVPRLLARAWATPRNRP